LLGHRVAERARRGYIERRVGSSINSTFDARCDTSVSKRAREATVVPDTNVDAVSRASDGVAAALRQNSAIVATSAKLLVAVERDGVLRQSESHGDAWSGGDVLLWFPPS
jgi:hypothetical protein